MATHYETLGVSETATQDEIKRAYRSLASKNHPDKGGDTAKFQEIQAAYAAIETPEKRERYDNERKGMGQPFQWNNFGGGQHSEMDLNDILRNFGFNFGGDPFMRQHHHQQQQPRKNKDLRINLPVHLADSLDISKRVVSVRTTRGEEQTVEIEVPKGVHNNTTVKYTGLGDNFFTTLPRGDLHVHFHLLPHPHFEVSGYDLVAALDINCLDAIIGCEQEFQTLDNKTFSITIPAGTQMGTKFKVPAQGLFSAHQQQRGNLYLIANIIVPTNLTQEQLDIVRSLTTK
jgi:DnaJ-class molecular chaperone